MNNLQYYRLLKGISQSQLAQKSGVSSSMISFYEQEIRDISKAAFNTVIALADALDLENPKKLIQKREGSMDENWNLLIEEGNKLYWQLKEKSALKMHMLDIKEQPIFLDKILELYNICQIPVNKKTYELMRDSGTSTNEYRSAFMLGVGGCGIEDNSDRN